MCEELLHFAVDQVIRAGYGQQYASASAHLAHAKQSKVATLPDLLALVEHSLPEFRIPAHLRPEGTTAPPFEK